MGAMFRNLNSLLTRRALLGSVIIATACAVYFISSSLFPPALKIAERCFASVGNGSSKTVSHVSVWAWQQDEDMSFIDSNQASISYFAGMIYVRGPNVSFRPRTQKLKLPPGAVTVPVFRIETLRQANGGFTNHEIAPEPESARFVVKSIVRRLKQLPASNMVQIDFDALSDEREFYKLILKQLRRELPEHTKISVTALASWLLEDRWLVDGDADEIVAMLFSIGADRKNVLDRIRDRGCNSGISACLALGVSVSEPQTNKVLFDSHVQKKFDKLYLFNSQPWTKKKYQTILREALNR